MRDGAWKGTHQTCRSNPTASPLFTSEKYQAMNNPPAPSRQKYTVALKVVHPSALPSLWCGRGCSGLTWMPADHPCISPSLSTHDTNDACRQPCAKVQAFVQMQEGIHLTTYKYVCVYIYICICICICASYASMRAHECTCKP